MLEETHSAEIGRALGRSRSRVKDAVDSLEREGLIVGTEVGGTRRLRLNDRYVAAAELSALLLRLGEADTQLQDRLATLRRRPRRAGKPL